MTTSTTHQGQRRRWRFAIAVALSACVVGLVSVAPSSVSASTENVVIYFAVCDGSGATDTVKIKKINEDGTGLTVIGDTTIAHCVQPATRYLTGLAVSGDYAYFGWINGDFASAGIGRMKTNGTGTVEMNYAVAPAGVGWFQMSPTPLNGYLYVYVHDGGQSPSNMRIMRMSIASGELSDCFTPSGNTNDMSIGVGRTAVYFSRSAELGVDQKLYKVSNDCSAASEVIDFEMAPTAPAMLHRFNTGYSATLLAESDSNTFLYTKRDVDSADVYGISQVDGSATLSGFQQHLYRAEDGFADSQVWGFNYLYFKDGAARKMYRVKPGGTVERAFEAQIPGDYALHHFSVVKETVAPATPPPATKAPLLVSKKGVTGKQIASDLGLTIPKGSKVKLVVAKKSRNACAVKKKRVVSTKAGKNCRVTITITPKKGKAIKRTTSFTTS